MCTALQPPSESKAEAGASAGAAVPVQGCRACAAAAAPVPVLLHHTQARGAAGAALVCAAVEPLCAHLVDELGGQPGALAPWAGGRGDGRARAHGWGPAAKAACLCSLGTLGDLSL